jgi:uncharacterized tellurite resistance protein B-like protein
MATATTEGNVEGNVKTLVKILIGAAWIDGVIQPQEREYLHRVAKEKGVAEDPEIQPLLYELRAVKAEECYDWVRQYLGNHPSQQDFQNLMEAISGLIYSDGTVANEEARLLTGLMHLEAEEGRGGASAPILKSIRSLYQRWLAKLN